MYQVVINAVHRMLSSLWLCTCIQSIKSGSVYLAVAIPLCGASSPQPSFAMLRDPNTIRHDITQEYKLRCFSFGNSLQSPGASSLLGLRMRHITVFSDTCCMCSCLNMRDSGTELRCITL